MCSGRTYVPVIACLSIPGLELQAALRRTPALALRPAALAPEAGAEPLLGPVTRAAEAAGVRPGMRLGEALATCPDLVLVEPDPAAAENPTQAPPDVAGQRRIMGLVVGYVSKVIPQLPNFLGTRTTVRYEDTPQLQLAIESAIPYRPLHEIRKEVAFVSYSDGREVVERVSQEKADQFTKGLQTEGIFGAFLGRVLVDAAQSTLKWGHWEAGTQGKAVFEFAVPTGKSHYEVDYCCMTNQSATRGANDEHFRRVVSYHGEMAIDPATGAILRLVVVADLERNEPVTQSAILVDYGPVEIGGRKYICPTRSLTLLTGQTFQIDPNFKFALANQMQPMQTVLDDVTFSQYHVFRAEARILTAEKANVEGHSGAQGSPLKEGSETSEAKKPNAAEELAGKRMVRRLGAMTRLELEGAVIPYR